MPNELKTLDEIEKGLEKAATAELEAEPASYTPTLSTKGKKFRLGETQLGETMDVVVAGTMHEHAFYDRPYDPNNVCPPCCFAIGKEENELVPDPSSPVPQAKTCKECPQNEWGSGQGKGKACRNSRRLGLYAYGADGLDAKEMVILRLAPKSLKNYMKYSKSIAATLKRPTYSVITQLGFEPTEDYPMVTEVLVDKITNAEELQLIIDNQELVQETLLEPYDVTTYEPTAGKKSKMS
jgi:hypothetical protein